MNIKQIFTTLLQYILPHHPLSRLMGVLTQCKNKTFKNLFIRLIVWRYHVNMDEALQPDINAYANFNQFFTRKLNPAVRPITAIENAIASPADGSVSQSGLIINGTIIQAKGKDYTAKTLLGGDQQRAEIFNQGKFATIYLSPKDYHRLHMPLTGTLREMVYIPGRLFSVGTSTTDSVPNLFARNERVVAIFDTEAGPMALILVGAIFVASIETIWDGLITPPAGNEIKVTQYPDNPPVIKKGEEMGRFNMGSTIIVLFGQNKINWLDEFKAGQDTRLGEAIGKVL